MSLIQGFTNFLKVSEPSQNSRCPEVDIKSFIGRTNKDTVLKQLGSMVCVSIALSIAYQLTTSLM